MINPTLDFERPLVELEKRIEELRNFSREKEIDLSEEIATLEKRAEMLRREIFDNLTPWQRVQIARHPRRPTTLDYINLIFDEFIELHGDRAFRDDGAVVGGIASLAGRPVTVVGTQKGRDTKENLARNFGMPHPEGYRKALRLIRQAEKFRRPVVSFVDVVGAYPGVEAEERGQGQIIARNLEEISRLATCIVVVITGEGGSGGALAIGVGDRLLMLENAYFSVISPEGCAAILWKDGSKAQEAADVLKLTAPDMKRLGIVDEVLPEPLGAAHKDRDAMARIIKDALIRSIDELAGIPPRRLIERRYARLRRIGEFMIREAAQEGFPETALASGGGSVQAAAGPGGPKGEARS
ncbi:MAG TPA: acetyl-CoA carboxylase carboxyltransferase subunit alpha [Firmicutes bacterium]|nr:acetyl-CoA carboxylase carboxyltransferase subunit alpha [Bacillota bacterium]